MQELKFMEHYIYGLQIETELQLLEAKTVEQVLDIYWTAQKSLGMVNAFDITTML